MNFVTNVFTRRDTHQDHLRVFVREQDFPEIIVRERRLLDILELHKYAYASYSMILSKPRYRQKTCPQNLSTCGSENNHNACSRM